MAANDNDARRYARRSAGAMRVPEWRGEPGGELDDVKYGEGFRARQSNSRDDYAEANDYEYETRGRNIDTEANGESARDYDGRTAPRDGGSTRARSAQSRGDEYRRRAPVLDDYEREPDYADERGTARTRRAIMMTTPHGGLTRVRPLMTSGSMTSGTITPNEGRTRVQLLMTSGITQTGTMITAITMSRTATIRTTTNAITANNMITTTALAANHAAAQTRAPRSTVCPA